MKKKHATKNIMIKRSPIHGYGMFSDSFIECGTIICTFHLGITSGFNHSCYPNVNLVGDRFDFVTIHDILPDEELTVSYCEHRRPEPCNCPVCKTFVL